MEGERWGPRVLDIDILLYDDVAIVTDELIIPHKFLVQRDFVMAPLIEISPEIVEPESGRPVKEILAELLAKHEGTILSVDDGETAAE